MTSHRIWRFSLLVSALPWAVVSACGGRTGDDLQPELPTPPNLGGGSGGASSGIGATNAGAHPGSGIGVGRSSGGRGTGPNTGATMPGGPGVFGAGGAARPPPPRLGTGGLVAPPPFGAGGAIVFPPPFGAGGVSGSGGVASGGTGGVTECFPPGHSVAEVCAPPGLPVTTCCTSLGHCGVELFPETLITNIPLAGGCQQMNQPGYAFAGCPDLADLIGQPQANVTLPACCRLDGMCGLDLSAVGAGCVQSSMDGKSIPCEFADGGSWMQAHPPKPPPVIVDAGVD